MCELSKLRFAMFGRNLKYQVPRKKIGRKSDEDVHCSLVVERLKATPASGKLSRSESILLQLVNACLNLNLV